MARDDLTGLLQRLRQAARAGADLSAAQPAEVSRLLRLDAVTLSLLPTRGSPELLWSDPADTLGRALEDMQYTLAEGPTFDAARTGEPVTETDLAAAPADRWPLFTPAACDTPARAVIAHPLLLGVVTAGVLTGYRTTPGPLLPSQRQDIARFARIALDLLLHTPPHALTTGSGGPDGPDLQRAEVHQAAGKLTVYLDISIDDALLRLRAHAWRHNQALPDVARAVITGRLRLDPDT
ncbi:GAF and ANTAR domain-containing protein [Streptomyces sp. NPDC004111]|uniref:GAF and ANTAR domain-containing protein n=1 Tax=Streptomyces sp. NPDC004111 TaxID=3364690 RepID=UPI003698C4B9